MDHSFPPHKDDSRSRSYQPRSSSGVPVSAIETTAPSLDFSGLDFFNAPRTAPLDFRYSSSASSREEAPSPSYTTAVPAPTRSATFINTPTPISQPYSPFAAVSALSPHFLERRWTDNDLSSESTSSFVQQQHHHNQHQLHHFHLDRTADRSPTLSSTAELPGTMSTLAVHYDPSFATMGSRPSFTWPAVLEPNGLGHDASLDHLSDAALTPASGSSRSITASPPRPSLTPEQRELKRQQDAVRRDTKNSMRIRRTSTLPYTHSPPMSSSVSDTMSMSIPVYSAAPPTVSLMAETPTGLPPPPQQQQQQQQQQQYMQPYSPPLTEPSSAGTAVFTPTYAPPMQHGYGISMDYPAYPATSSYDGRPVPAIYPMPGGMPSSAIHPDEAHVRVVQSRPKPQCWDHGCNGRQFSTFSNLLRHQREKSGQATKSVCPQCGQSFTRSTARNGHITQGKCRGRSSDMNDESDPQDESASLDASLKSDGGRSE